MRDPLRHVVEHFLAQLHCLLLVEVLLSVYAVLDAYDTVVLILKLHNGSAHRVDATVNAVTDHLLSHRSVDPPPVYLQICSSLMKTVDKDILAIFPWGKSKIESQCPRLIHIHMGL